MRAHTIPTNARRGLVLVVGVAVGLLMLGISAPASTSTAPTTRAASMTLSLTSEAVALGTPAKWLTFGAQATDGSTLVLRGDVKRTTVRLRNNDPTSSPSRPFNAKLKHPEQLRGRRVKVTIKAAATDVYGQTASEKIKFVLRRCKPSDEGHFDYAVGDLCDERL